MLSLILNSSSQYVVILDGMGCSAPISGNNNTTE